MENQIKEMVEHAKKTIINKTIQKVDYDDELKVLSLFFEDDTCLMTKTEVFATGTKK